MTARMAVDVNGNLRMTHDAHDSADSSRAIGARWGQDGDPDDPIK
jgi:hypothetical protein